MIHPKLKVKSRSRTPLSSFLVGSSLAALGLLLRLPFHDLLGDRTPFLFFIPAVVLSASAGGFAAGVWTTMLASAATFWFLLPHRMDPPSLFGLVVFTLTGLFTSQLCAALDGARGVAEQARAEAEEAAAALKESDDRFRQISENVNLVLAMTTGFNTDAGPRLLFVNSAYERIWGRSCESLYQHPRSWVEAVHPDDLERVQTALSDMVRAQFDCQFRVVRPDGEVRWVYSQFVPVRNEAGEVYRSAGIIEDITDRKRAEELLEANELRLRQLFDAIPAFVWTADHRGSVLHFNRRWYEYTGRTERESLGFAWAEALHPDDREGAAGAWLAAVGEEKGLEVETRARRADGSYRWFIARAEPLRDEKGEVTLWFGTATDVHDRKTAEEALREADRCKDEYLAMLAHELRNPLAPIIHAVELLDAYPVDPGAADRHRQVIARQTRHMARLLDDLLDVSRMTRGVIELRPQPLSISRVVHDALETSSPLIAQRGHFLCVSLPEAPIWVEADPTRLNQILWNLLGNAAKYTDPGGRIWVDAASIDGEAEIRVRDTGKGIPPEQLPHIFELFTQVEPTIDRTSGGLGIGLTMVKRLVDMHGGRIEARSDGPGQGSEFIIRLPLLDGDHSAPPALTPRLEVDSPRTARRVLLIEDNVDAAETLAELITAWGCEVSMALDGKRGLEAAESFAPDTVLLDIGLPGIDGYEVARCLRVRESRQAAAGEALTLIALTGYGQAADREKAWEAGFDHHLTKPVNPATLRDLLTADASMR